VYLSAVGCVCINVFWGFALSPLSGSAECGTYMTDGKFHPTFKSRAEKCVFSIPLFMTWCPQIAQICTYIFKKFPAGNTQNPQNWEAHSRLLPSATAYCPTFSQLPRPLPFTACRHLPGLCLCTRLWDFGSPIPALPSGVQVEYSLKTDANCNVCLVWQQQ